MKLISTVIFGLSILTINIFSQNSSQSIKWSSIGDGITGVNAEVKAIAVNGIDIYAGGFFTNAGRDSAGGIAKWDGANWLPLGSGIAREAGYSVVSILATGNNIYAGGLFNEIDGMPINNLAIWDGANWSDVGNGLGVGGAVGDAVLSIVMLDNKIYFGGTFQSAGGDYNISSIAIWNGSNWVVLAGE